MTIEVEGPDGAVIEFPDGTPTPVMQKAMAAHYGTQQAAPQGPKPSAPSMLNDISNAAGSAANFMTLGAQPWIQGAGAGFNAAAHGGKFSEGFKQGKQQFETNQADFAQRRPLVNVAAQTVGGAIPALATAGTAPAGEMAASFWGRRGQDALKGGLFGSIAGANAAVGGGSDPMKQLGQVLGGAGTGMILGPVTGGAIEGGGKLASMAGNALNRVQINPNVASMSGAGKVSIGPPNQPPPRMSAAEAQMASRGGLSADKLSANMEGWRQAGIVPTKAEAYGEPGLQRLRTLSNFPGKTGTRTADYIEKERAAQVGQLVDAGEKALGKTPLTTFSGALDKYLKTIGKGYDPLFESAGATIKPEALPDIQAALSRIPQPIMDEATAKMAERSTWRGADPKNISEPRKFWYIKKHLDTVIAKLEKNDDSMLPDVIPVQRALIEALEKGVPGYKALNAKYSDAAKAKDAVAWGKSVLASGTTTDESAAAYSKMSPLQKRAGRAGLRGDFIRRVQEASGAEGAPHNAANAIKGQMGDKIRSVLAEDAQPLLQTVGMSGKHFRNLSFVAPRSGSNSVPMAADAMDMIAQTPPTKKGVTKMLDEGLGMAWGHLTRPVMEGFRDTAGAHLLQPMTRAEQERLMAAMRQLEVDRASARVSSRNSGLLGGQYNNRQGQ